MLGEKESELLASSLWNTAFYTHVLFGGVSLIVGWPQFSQRLRRKRIQLHRNLGKVYLGAVALGGLAGLYIAIYALGGTVAQLGFGALALGWLFCTWKAYTNIRSKEIQQHRYWMLRSYALCWAAVTLRLWLPIFEIFTDLTFPGAYRIIAWLCWIPNLILAEFLIRRWRLKELAAHKTIAIQK